MGFSLLGAGLLALAAVEAGLLVRPAPRVTDARVTEQTLPAGALGSKYEQEPAAPPERGGSIVCITADTTTLGTALYRLWGSGRVEVSVLGESNTWTEWTVVAPGLSGKAPPPKKKDSQF